MRKFIFPSILLLALVVGVASQITNMQLGNADEKHLYHFEQGSGTIAYDTAGNKNLTIVNALWAESGPLHSVIVGDGAGDYAYSDTFPSYSPITVMYWGKIDNLASNKGIGLSKWDGDTWDAGHIDFHCDIGEDYNGYCQIYIGATDNVIVDQVDGGCGLGWHHWAFTAEDNGTVILYKDGIFHNSADITDTLKQVGDGTLNILTKKKQWYCTGRIDEIAIYNRVLSAGEIYQKYSRQAEVYQ